MNDIQEPVAERPKVRWWPAVVLTSLAVLALLTLSLGDEQDQQARVTISFGILLLLALGLFLWLVFFSRLAKALRIQVVVLGVFAFAGFFTFFKVQGVTGNLLPILAPRFSGSPKLVARSSTARIDVAKVDISSSPADFPQFRGAARGGKVPAVRLARDWTLTPPRELWRRPVGAGWSGFAIVGGLALTQEQREDQEVVAAYSLATGEPVWSHAAPGAFENAIGGDGPRATPTVEGGQVFTFGPTGLLRSLELATGKLLWFHQAAEENGGKTPEWGYAGSPLLVDDLVVVSVGGNAGRSLVAYNRTTGAKVWSGGDDRAGFASPLLATLAGHQQVVIFGESSLTGHSPANGEVWWTFPWSSKQANVAQPLVLGENRLLISSGYGVGSALIEIDHTGDEWIAKQLWQSNQMKAKFSNLIEYEGKIYGFDDGIFACLDPTTGQRCWKEGRYGHGQILLVGDLLLLLSEKGEMVLIEPNPQKLVELGRFEALSAKTWNTFAVSGKLLLVRNHLEAACFELPLAP